ncbi:hypothetical protein [Undibacterium sp. TJN19]|uniref:hypothetical protein n=1 Tax=Undibacterium sp. TJN19 TaxID=3413055 RepID=UPI003BF01FFA
MNTLLMVTVSIASLLLVLNLYVSLLVVKSNFYEPGQKYAQYALIWLLPVIGAIACYVFVRPTLGASNSQSAYDEDITFLYAEDGYAGPLHHDE